MKTTSIVLPNAIIRLICKKGKEYTSHYWIKNTTLTLFITVLSTVVALAQELPDTVYLQELIIESGKYIPYIKEVTKEQDISKHAVRDIGDYLRSMPNVSGIRRGGPAIDPVVRGFRYSQLNVFMDNGVHVEGGCPNRMDPVASHVEIEDIQQIEVIKGPFLLRYGPSLGGLINLKTIQPVPNDNFEVHAKAIYGYESNWEGQRKFVSIFGGNQKIFFNTSFGHKKYGNYEDGNENTVQSSFKKYNYAAKFGFSPIKDHTFILSYSQVFGRNIMFPSLPMDETKDDTRIVSFDYSILRRKKFFQSLDFKIYSSNVDHTMDNSRRPNYTSRQAVSTVNGLVTGGRVELGFEKAKTHLFFGGDHQQTDKDGTRTMIMIMNMPGMPVSKTTLLSNLWNKARINNTGIFAEVTTSLNNYDLSFALRGDYNHATSEDTLQLDKEGKVYFGDVGSQFFNLSASMGASKALNKHLKLGLYVGKGTRSPDMLERFIKFLPVGYDNYDYLGDLQLKPETNYQADLTIQFTNVRYGRGSFNIFYAYTDQFITAELLPSSVAKPKTMDALGVKQFINANYALLHGFEFSYNTDLLLKLIVIDAIASYTGGVIDATSKYLITNKQVIGNETINNDPLPEMPPFEATIGVSSKISASKIVPKAEIRLVAPQNHISNAYYEPKTPGFAVANFSVHFQINKFVAVTAGVNNILNERYYEHLNRRILGSAEKLYEPGRVFFGNLLLRL